MSRPRARSYNGRCERFLGSFAERIGFDFAFLLAGGSTVLLLSAKAGWIFSGWKQGAKACVILALLYLLIHLLLRLDDNSLLVGAMASFLAVAAAMYFTRKLDCYSLLRNQTLHDCANRPA